MTKQPPWLTHKHIWNTQSKYMSYIRGGIRRGLWNKSPIKLEFMKDNRERVPLGRKTEKNPEGLVWGGTCHYCSNQFKQSELEVDHINGGNSLKSMDDLRDFMEAMLFVEDEDLRLSCKACHKIKTNSERKGISFEDSARDKQAIVFSKLPVKQQVDKLNSLMLNSMGNAKVRRATYTKYLKETKCSG